MAKCRAILCGCDVGDSINAFYCAHCAEFTPICPCCGAVYAEHRPECVVANWFNDSLEGPWPTRALAEDFACAEVGVAWQVERGLDGRYYLMVNHEND